MPRIFQQIDFSDGGDGIVTRGGIGSIGDLRGKKIVLAQNSRSLYFLRRMLANAGVQPREVQLVSTDDQWQANAVFNANRVDAVVCWAPAIYDLAGREGNKMLVSTESDKKAITNVWFARADLANERPDICEAMVRGIFDSMQELGTEEGKKKAAKLVAEGYGLTAAKAIEMLSDSHSTNWAENYQFFLNRDNPAGFERVWNQIYSSHKNAGIITHRQVSFDQVVDFSIVRALGREQRYSSQIRK